MKKCNLIILVSLMLYGCAALYVMDVIRHLDQQQDATYRVEINRYLDEQADNGQPDEKDLQAYPHLKEVTYLDREQQDEETLQAFYTMHSTDSFVVVPWFQNTELMGYIRFSYERDGLDMQHLQIVCHGALLLLEVALLIVLLCVRNRVIKPFLTLRELPLKMAEGQLNGDVKVEKNSYFKEYLWGMSVLKDTLYVSKKRELELLREKKQLLLSLSHDIKTPLNLIKLYNKALQDHVYHDAHSMQQAYQQIALKCVEMEQYIQAIMTSSREDILDLPVVNSEFYLADLIRDVQAVYQEQCQLRNVSLQIDSFANCILHGDIHRVYEVFENLFENAFKYGDGCQIRLSFTKEEYCQLIHVFSSGNPIEEQEARHLFDSFYRGANSKGKAGNGLGLYICQELMHKMDGAIYVERSREGMCFVVVLR